MHNPPETKFMQEAIKEAKKAYQDGEVPIGAVIVHNKKIIARAYNQVEKLKDPTAHAEILAITQASEYLQNWRLENCEIYVTIKPCTMCLGAIKNARIKKLTFGAPSPVNQNKKNELIIEGNVCQDECAKIIKEFFKQIRHEH
jgi:tRNA(adenine34) deaminase